MCCGKVAVIALTDDGSHDHAVANVGRQNNFDLMTLGYLEPGNGYSNGGYPRSYFDISDSEPQHYWCKASGVMDYGFMQMNDLEEFMRICSMAYGGKFMVDFINYQHRRLYRGELLDQLQKHVTYQHSISDSGGLYLLRNWGIRVMSRRWLNYVKLTTAILESSAMVRAWRNVDGSATTMRR